MALRGGSFLADRPPSFSSDGKFILACTGCTVSVLSVATGLRVAELQGHTDRVTSVVVVQGQGMEEAMSIVTHAWTSSFDKTIRLWNFLTGKEIKVIEVGYSVVSMVIPRASKTVADDKSVVFLSVAWDKPVKFQRRNKVKIAKPVPLNDEKDDDGDDEEQEGDSETELSEDDDAQESKPGPVDDKLLETREDIAKKEFRGYVGRIILLDLSSKQIINGHLAKTKTPRLLVGSRTGSFVGMADSAKLWIWKVPTTSFERCSEVQTTILHPWKPLTTMAFGPTETLVAAGDGLGQITIWKNFGERKFYSSDYFQGKNDSRRPDANDDIESRTRYHWHHKAVKCLSFTSDGAYLLSGGEEGVLVLWQLDTAKQQYLPRLGSYLRYIISAPDPSLFTLSMADNSLRFLNIASMQMVRVIHGIKPVVACPSTFQWTRVLHHLHGTIALLTANLSVQFYDVLRDKHAMQIQVSPRNFVSIGQSIQNFGQSTMVTHIAFSADASVMTTVDLRVPESGVGGGSFLKFWNQSTGEMPYILHTSVDNPHGGEILALVYHPSEHITVTCSNAKDFKLWMRSKNKEKNIYNWRCTATGSYRNKRMQAAAFSHDGTLLAIAAEEFITLWNPLSNTILCVLSIPGGFTEVIGMLSFVPKCPYLVSASLGEKPQLTVWNLSTLSVWWSYRIRVEAITADPQGQQFAVLSSNPAVLASDADKKTKLAAQVCLFKPESPVPISAWSFNDGIGGTLLFLPPSEEVNEAIDSNSTNSKLLVFNRHREYVLFDPLSDADAKPASKIEAKAPIDNDGAANELSSFSSLYVTTTTTSKRVQHDQLSKIKAPQPWGDLLNAPSHVLPSLTDVGQQILETFLQRRR